MAVVFNGTTRQIEITDVLDFSFDVEKDIYSRWKDWAQLNTTNAGYARAFTQGTVFGGNTTVAGQTAPKYFLLTNFWLVNINNGNINTIGLNLYSDDFSTPYLITSGGVIDQNSDSPVVTIISGSGVTAQDKLDIADQVWDELKTDHTGVGSMAEEIDEAKAFAKKSSKNAEEANLKL